MCKNAEETVGALLGAVEPELINFLTIIGVANTPDGQAAITAYDVALKAVQMYVPGTAAETTIEVIDGFTAVFNTLPIPLEVKGLADAISAVIVVVIGVLKGNAPAPAAPTGVIVTATAEEVQHAHADEMAKETEAKVATLLPGFKRSKYHSIQHQWEGVWNKEVAKAAQVDAKYAALALKAA